MMVAADVNIITKATVGTESMCLNTHIPSFFSAILCIKRIAGIYS
jgi:hypothetical protein